MTPSDDIRDLHLREALRHAPDGQQRPPAALSASILRAARLATAPAGAPRPAPRPGWLVWWDRLAQPRVAGGFASVMVATLVGLIWWDRPMDEALPQRPQAPRAAPAPAAQPGHLPEQAAAARPEAAQKERGAPQLETSHARQASGSPAGSESKPPSPLPAPPAAAEARSDAAASAGSPAPLSTQPTRAEQPRAEATAARDKTTAMPPPAPISNTDSAALPGTAAAQDGLARRQRQTDGGETRSAPAPIAAAPMAAAPQADPSHGLTPLRALLPAEAAHWSWQHGAATGETAPQPIGPALLEWLALLDRAGAGAWTVVPEAVPPSNPTHELRLSRDGLPQHRFLLQGDTVWWIRGTAPSQLLRVRLPESTLATLSGRLDELR